MNVLGGGNLAVAPPGLTDTGSQAQRRRIMKEFAVHGGEQRTANELITVPGSAN
jgi:hypothetical protein